jgi:hypothetical protein
LWRWPNKKAAHPDKCHPGKKQWKFRRFAWLQEVVRKGFMEKGLFLIVDTWAGNDVISFDRNEVDAPQNLSARIVGTGDYFGKKLVCAWFAASLQ